MWKSLLSALILVSSAGAATIIAVTEYPGSGRGGTTGGTNLAVQVSFTVSQAYNNVVFSADLDPHASDTGRAFLTRVSGPGTTVADEVASGEYTMAASTHAWTPVLSIPNLSAGSYFLTLSTDGFNFGIGALPTPLVTLAPGASVGPSAYAVPEATYAPASNFGAVPAGYQYLFTMTGDPVSSTVVPEPSSFVPLAVAAGLGSWLKRRRSLRR